MKLRIPAAVYKENWTSFMAKYADSADLETKLAKAMAAYSELPEVAIAIVKKMEAQKIADACKESLISKKHSIDNIEAGKASLGYTTLLQEKQAMRELIESFDFTAICLALFKKKHDLA